VRERGGFSTGIPVPATIQELLVSRIDRLPLRNASCFSPLSAVGADIAFSLAAALVDDLRTSSGGGSRGCRRRNSSRACRGGDTEYTFGPPLMQEVAYDLLLPEAAARPARRSSRP